MANRDKCGERTVIIYLPVRVCKFNRKQLNSLHRRTEILNDADIGSETVFVETTALGLKNIDLAIQVQSNIFVNKIYRYWRSKDRKELNQTYFCKLFIRDRINNSSVVMANSDILSCFPFGLRNNAVSRPFSHTRRFALRTVIVL